MGVNIVANFVSPAYDIAKVKRGQVALADLYTLSPSGSLRYRGGWNPAALAALGIAGLVSIGLALLGAYGVILDVGDWGWLIGAALGALVYLAAGSAFGGAAVGKPALTGQRGCGFRRRRNGIGGRLPALSQRSRQCS